MSYILIYSNDSNGTTCQLFFFHGISTIPRVVSQHKVRTQRELVGLNMSEGNSVINTQYLIFSPSPYLTIKINSAQITSNRHSHVTCISKLVLVLGIQYILDAFFCLNQNGAAIMRRCFLPIMVNAYSNCVLFYFLKTSMTKYSEGHQRMSNRLLNVAFFLLAYWHERQGLKQKQRIFLNKH